MKKQTESNAAKNETPRSASKFERGVRKPHWYKQFVEECPMCGRGEKHRERVYGKKPKDTTKVYFFEQVYDHCMERAF